MYRKIIAAIFIGTLALNIFAQKPSANKAYNLFYEQNFAKAKEVIDRCVADEKLGTKAQTWLYKANIDYRLAAEEYSKKQEDDSYVIKFPNTPIEAYDAFLKAKSLNKNIMATDMFSPDEGAAKLYVLLFICAANEVVNGNYEVAQPILEKAVASYEMTTPENPLNGELYYYYAYTLDMLKRPNEAQQFYEKAIRDNSTNASVYIRLIEHYKTADNRAKVLEIIELGKKTLQNDPNIAVAEADYYYWIDDKTMGRQLLNNLPANVFTTPDAIANVANLHIRDSNYVEAEKLLKNAYRLNPGSFVIVYNLGVCCYQISVQKTLEANELEVKNNKTAAATLKEEADNSLKEAERYFEKALEYEPNDMSVLTILKNIYARLQSPKYDAIELKIKQLEN